jgi:2-phospho-L-lactate guanylyltransferase
MGMASWAVVMPVKPLATAKTRLRPGLPGVAHERLVLGFALDTVTAVLASGRVAELVVVTDDPVVAETLGEAGAYAVPDKPDAGLNAAVSYGASLTGAALVAALAADLPALHPAELAAALDAAAAVPARSFVPDAPGTGTVLLAAHGALLGPRFGRGSAALHEASGAIRLVGAWPTLRRDVDTIDDLAEAGRLGLGAQTTALLRCADAGHGLGI